MFPGPTELLFLDWLFDRINLDSKIQIKYIDTKNQLADILNKGNFTRDEWNHLLCLFNISHFSSTVCSDTLAKRSQHDSGGERVTAKSRPMMNLVARTPSHVWSSTSISPEKRSYGSQDPWNSIATKEERSGRLDKGTDLFEAFDHHDHDQFMENFSSASYSKCDDDRAWSSQEWKTEIKTYERSGRPDINSQEDARPQQFIIGNDETELELSVESRSFVNRVNDQVRKRQKRISNVTGDGEEHSMIWGMFMAVTMESAEFMGKNYSDNCHSIANTTDLTMKQMFDMSTKLVSEQDEISGLETIGWENHS